MFSDTTVSDEFTLISSVQKTEYDNRHRRKLRIVRKYDRHGISDFKHWPTQTSGLIKLLMGASRQDIAILGGILTSLYLLNGEHSQFVCNIGSSIPAIFLTYRLIANPNTKTKSLKRILGFWVLFAVLLSLDQLMGHAFGYYSAKFLLMIAIFVYMERKCETYRQSNDCVSSNEEEYTDVSNDEYEARTNQSFPPELPIIINNTFSESANTFAIPNERVPSGFAEKRKISTKKPVRVRKTHPPILSLEPYVDDTPLPIDESDYCGDCQSKVGIHLQVAMEVMK